MEMVLTVMLGRRNYLNESKVKHYMYQLLKSIEHMHKNGIFHRDIKPYFSVISSHVLILSLARIF